MEREENFQFDERSSGFLDRLLGVVQEFAGEQALEEFRRIKTEREKYLHEQWLPAAVETGQVVLRDIDYEHLLTLLQEAVGEDFDRYFQAHTRIVRICLEFGKYDRAFSILNDLTVPTEDLQKQGEYYMLFGKMYLFINAYQESFSSYKKALDIYQTLGIESSLAAVYNNLGIVAHEQWQIEDGKYFFEKAEQLAKSLGDEHLQVMVEMNLGIVHNIRGESEKAYQMFESLYQYAGDRNIEWLLQLHVNQSLSARDCGRIDEAKAILQKAEFFVSEIQNRGYLGTFHLAYGEVLLETEEYEESLGHLGIAFKIFSQLFDLVNVADVYRAFAVLHTRQGYYELADSEFRISLRVNNEKGNIHNLAVTNYEYSELARVTGQKEAERERLQKSLSFYETIGASARIRKIQSRLDELT